MTREELIKRCEQNVLQESDWSNRDDPGAMAQLGEMWAYLKAGCEFEYKDDSVTIKHKTFSSIEWGSERKEESWFYFLDY